MDWIRTFIVLTRFDCLVDLARCSEPRRRGRVPKRAGFTVLELLVTMSIIGILVALLLPAIGAVRETARRVQCVDQLRQTGLALHQHHNAKLALPAGWQLDLKKETAFGWAVETLPFLEQQSLKDKIDAKRALLDPGFADIRSHALMMMLCPSDITEPTFVLYEEGEHEDEHTHAQAVSGAVKHAIEGATLSFAEPNQVDGTGSHHRIADRKLCRGFWDA